MSCNRVEVFWPGCLRLFDHVLEDMEMISKETIDVRIELADRIVARPTRDTQQSLIGR